MKKTIITMLFGMALGTAATAQTQVMTVIKKDGTKQTFRVAQVEKVAFEQREMPELTNQFAVNDDAVNISGVTERQDAEGTTYTVYIENDAAVVGYQSYVTIYVASDLIGKEIDLATADPSQVSVTATYPEYESLEGTLKVSYDKFKKNVTLALESLTDRGDDLRLAYTGAFDVTYTATNEFGFTPAEGSTTTYAIPSVLRVKAAEQGGSTSIAFGNVQAAVAEDLLTADNAVWFTLSASKLYNGSVDLATEKESYTFRFIDYATGTVYEDVTEGTITTASTSDGKVYFKLNATLADGTVVEGEYFGEMTDVESLDAMIPIPVLPNEFTYFNSDGVQTNHGDIVTVMKKVSTSGGYTTLYFMPEGASQNDTYSTPQLQFGENLVNVGKVNLAELKDGDLFAIKFSNINLTSPDEKYYGFANVPDNGTLSIAVDDEGNYDIYLEVVNRYNNSYTTGGGDNSKLILSYKGTVTE